VTPMSDGRYRVEGRVRARIGQTCVVTLDPMETDIDEPIDLIFAPPDQIPQMAIWSTRPRKTTGRVTQRIPDPPEPIENGINRSRRLVTDALYLAVDPYPRKPDAVFEPLVEAPDPKTTHLPR